MSKRTRRPSIAIEDGVIELKGRDGTPKWIWAHTCPDLECDCRSALVIAARGDKDVVLQAARVAELHCHAGRETGTLDTELGENGAAFEIEIETEELRPLKGSVDSMAELRQLHPWIDSVLEAINGETLEKLARLWYHGKGRPDPESSPQPASNVGDWKPGDEVSWVEAYDGVRLDQYVEGGRLYEAVETYCVTPDCACGRVLVRFDDLDVEDIKSSEIFIGTATVQPSGEWTLESDTGPRELLERLWSRYLQRHPNFMARHAERYPRMKAFGETLVLYHAARQRIPRSKPRPNEPCPCGSGKKYKKCCRLKLSG